MHASYKKFLTALYAYSFFAWSGPIITMMSILMRDRNLSPIDMAIAVSMMSVAKIICEIPSGTWADKFSRKKLVLFASFLDGFGIALWLFDSSSLVFMLSFFIFGISASAKSGTLEAFAFDKLKECGQEKEYARILSVSGGFASLGLMASCIMAYLIIDFGYNAIIIVSMIMAALTVVSLLFASEAKKSEIHEHQTYFAIMRDGFLAFKQNPMIFKIVLVSTIYGALAFTCGNLAGAIITEAGWSKKYLMIMFGSQIALEAVMKFILSHTERLRQFFVRHVFLMLIAGCVFTLVAGITYNFYITFIIWPLWGIDIIRYSILNPHVHNMVESRIRATVISVWGFIGEVKNILVIMGFGLAATYGSYSIALIIFALLTLFILAVYGILFHKDFQKLSHS